MTSFHFPRSWMQAIQFWIFSWQMSCLISSHLYLGLPSDLLVRGFQLNIFLTVVIMYLLFYIYIYIHTHTHTQCVCVYWCAYFTPIFPTGADTLPKPLMASLWVGAFLFLPCTTCTRTMSLQVKCLSINNWRTATAVYRAHPLRHFLVEFLLTLSP